VVDPALEHQPFPRFANEREMFTAAYRSSDHGSTWQKILPSGSSIKSASDMRFTRQPDTWFIVDEAAQHPYRTTDNGSTWALADSGLPAGGVAMRIFTTTVRFTRFSNGQFFNKWKIFPSLHGQWNNLEFLLRRHDADISQLH